MTSTLFNIFSCHFLQFWFFSRKWFRYEICYWVLVQGYTAPFKAYQAKSEKILMSFNNKYKSPCEMITTQLFHKKTKSKETVW